MGAIKLDKLLSDDTKKTKMPGNSNWAGESGMPGMSQNAKLSGWKNVEGIVSQSAQYGVGQGASPGKQGGQKPWETVLIRKNSGVVIDYISKNQIKRKTSRKSNLTLGDSIINNANMK